MWRLIKKWWFLQRLEAIILMHTAKNSFQDVLIGRTVLLNEQFFILGTKEYPGIIFRPLGRFSWLLLGRRDWKFENLDELMGTQSFKRKIHEYHNHFKYLKERKYIAWEPTESGTPYPNITYLADDVHGWAGLIQLVADTFKVPWGILIGVTIFLIGLNWPKIISYITN